ncbi:MAG: hypothetical protein AB7O43_08195 [Hyphomicrobiaceae bacterium]
MTITPTLSGLQTRITGTAPAAAFAPAMAWDETDVAPVAPADMEAAALYWFDRQRTGLALVGTSPTETIEHIEHSIVTMFQEPAVALAIVYRLRCLAEAMSTRRFAPVMRTHDRTRLSHLAHAASTLRVNAGIGFSPVRLDWASKALRFSELNNETAREPYTAGTARAA